MKTLVVAFLLLNSISAFSQVEVSATKCALRFSESKQKWKLTNEIKKNDYTINSNCLELVKGASQTTVDGKVKGVILEYTNP